MPRANSLALFLLATVMLNLTPGPDMLYVIARSLAQGRAAGIVSAFGIAAGCCVHTLAVAFGLVTVMAAIPATYSVVKYVGAAYLIFLGLRALKKRDTVDSSACVRPERLSAIFSQGALTNLLNPKVALFFLAFLPQFVNQPAGHVAAQIIFLVAFTLPSLPTCMLIETRDWLAMSTPKTTEDRTFQILGLMWSRERQKTIKRLVQSLMQLQRQDGGWSQLPTKTSDAYATGEVLTAVLQSGFASRYPRNFRRGIDFLLRTQQDDGSWFVESRSMPVQSYFETGFPHGRSQFISTAATSWATLALLDEPKNLCRLSRYGRYH